MHIIDSYGGIKNVYDILTGYGWGKKFHTLDMQVRRNRLSKEVILILMTYAAENNRPYRISDFFDVYGVQNQRRQSTERAQNATQPTV